MLFISPMKNLFAGRAMQMRVAVHQKVRFAWQMRNIAFELGIARDQRFFLQFCWVVRVISPRKVSAATAANTTTQSREKWSFFSGTASPDREEVKLIPQHFECATGALATLLHDAISDVNRVKGRLGITFKTGQNWDQCNPASRDEWWSADDRLIDRLQHRWERVAIVQ